jgi:hypothetical protein
VKGLCSSHYTYHKRDKNPEGYESYLQNKKEGRRNLADWYCVHLIKQSIGIKKNNIPQSLIDAKRLQIKSKRALKEHGIHIK